MWLVDDSPTQLARARELLSKHHTVETFSDAEQMLERLSLGQPPDVLLLDWQLPGISGLETCTYVREHHDNVALPILMLSSRGTHDDFTEGLQAGANDYVAKPFHDAELLARVDSLLRVRAQGERLREREAYLATTLSSIGDAVITTDRAGRVVFLNPVAERITGWSTLDAQQRPVAEVVRIIDAVTREPVSSPVERALAVGTVQGLARPTLLIRRDGTEVPIEDSAAPIRTGPQVISGAVLIFRDVTEQTQVRLRNEALTEQLRTSEAEQATLLDAIPALVSFVSADERYGRVNKAYEDWFGISQDLLRGQQVRDVIGEAAYSMLGPFVKRGLAGESFTFEQHDVPYRLGGKRDVKVSFIAHREPGQPVAGYVALLQDITARRKLEQERELHARRLQQQAEFEQQLIGIVSHDLRNPLSAILLGTERLKRQEVLVPNVSRTVDRIHASASRAVRLVKELLDFTQARLGGGIRIGRGPMDLHALSRTAVEEVEEAHPAARVEVVASGDGQGAWDADRLSQVLQNLVTNAVKYGQPGSPIQVATHGDSTQVTLRVHNEGAPIAPERLPDLFQPLQRGTHPVDLASRSVGLGLFIVKSIVDAHQGHIDVRSAAGEGTTFTVTLPR
ncbi:hybrid sensor histidine kinase/response regulator [Corallococcus carmarthensis]|uniref:hybrid sensor histidine kinase/response regulator n=1 Tax=Corallococcus carmarthensis TaxID=2316728 RepID=UPI0011C39C1C|nr:PAS domain S-box protein [Corallococcus carmarthensis]